MHDLPSYPSIGVQTLPLISQLLLGRPRSFRQDAKRLIQRVQPAPRILGSPPHGSARGLVLAVNHYCRPGFGAWWIALSIAAAVPMEMHWIMTSAWVYPDRFRSWLVTPLSRWALARIAHCYGFTSAPPMPPRPHEHAARAAALRKLLRTLDRNPSPILGIAPEGSDSGDGNLSHPPDGVGHLFLHLHQRKMRFCPVGVYEEDGCLVTRFGQTLEFGTSTKDDRVSRETILEKVMQGIAACLPPALRGCYK